MRPLPTAAGGGPSFPDRRRVASTSPRLRCRLSRHSDELAIAAEQHGMEPLVLPRRGAI